MAAKFANFPVNGYVRNLERFTPPFTAGLPYVADSVERNRARGEGAASTK